ncbi:MAG: hypothetical protein GVY10_11240 [Verrucomicrobia bacterium]|jgi:hypothetical protein|nr:hypothetical protein [Verrucomicrobiota bacterium]
MLQEISEKKEGLQGVPAAERPSQKKAQETNQEVAQAVWLNRCEALPAAAINCGPPQAVLP